MHVRQAPADDPVGVHAADLGPGGGLVVAGQRVGEELQVETLLLRQRFENADRFLPERVIDIEKGDLDALQVAARFLLDVADIVGGLAPIGRTDREYPFEDVAIDRIAAAGQRLNHDVAVLHDARQYRARYWWRQHVEHHHAFTLHLLVAFDAALRLVAMVFHAHFDRMTFDTAL